MKYSNDDFIKLLNERKSSLNKEEIDEKIFMDLVDTATNMSKKYASEFALEEDLFQEASLSIFNSIKNFDTSKNGNFIDFVKKKMEKDLKNYIDEEKKYSEKSLRISKALNRIIDAETRYYTIYNKYPDDEALAEYVHMDKAEFLEYKMYAFEILGIEDTIENKKKPLSVLIDSKNNTDDISDKDFEILNYSLNSLSETEKDIVSMYYGINGIEKKESEEIEKIYDISSEQLRQIIKKIERKLKREMVDEDDRSWCREKY